MVVHQGPEAQVDGSLRGKATQICLFLLQTGQLSRAAHLPRRARPVHIKLAQSRPFFVTVLLQYLVHMSLFT